ncbi:hypothetical protein GOB13_14875 [Sinorhizobium meliloti]|uniref:hypothetical protein n=1 Tax=Rhizobium meliloti TaxID=382 RepID=UPI000B4A4589|nr:hypothetical protein [Sinorhizobium meliloti]ASQ06403.1 hypothetical protein CDO23_20875 [Sinorhizobium meliloti]MDW9793983.1 hypothetical protein [Sinorhizobium meliloti]MDX0064535.1 hypothetical protein [Sinorhizobium meliloti]MDX0082606.1 hypothetical protein [Sinorhizobium meliloti]MQU67364.1 hypothetical protein [Sinorhizobium meliloti]
MTRYRKPGLAAVLAALITNAAVAADVSPLLVGEPRPAEAEGGWTFSVAPYFWIAGLSGDTAQFGLPTVHIDSSFSEIFGNLDFALMAAGEARYDRFSVIGDVIYTKLSADAETPLGILASDVDVRSESFSGLLGLGYAVLDGPDGHLDVVGGIKLWSVETTISLSGGLLGPREASDSATWVDGVVGLRGKYSFIPEIYLTGWGLVGSGGADIDWDVALGIGYDFNDRVSAIAGYRALGVDYSDDGFLFDTVQQGPILGLAIKF